MSILSHFAHGFWIVASAQGRLWTRLQALQVEAIHRGHPGDYLYVFDRFMPPVIKAGTGDEAHKNDIATVFETIKTAYGPYEALKLLRHSFWMFPQYKQFQDPRHPIYDFLADHTLNCVMGVPSIEDQTLLLVSSLNFFPATLAVNPQGDRAVVPAYLKIFTAALDSIDALAKHEPTRGLEYYLDLLEKHARHTNPHRILEGMAHTLPMVDKKSFLCYLQYRGRYADPDTNKDWDVSDFHYLREKFDAFTARVRSVEHTNPKASTAILNHFSTDFMAGIFADPNFYPKPTMLNSALVKNSWEVMPQKQNQPEASHSKPQSRWTWPLWRF